MNQIINYFYIFSKLTTSLVLLFVVFLMGYALFNSYKDVNITNNNLEDKIILLSNSIEQNKNKLTNIDNKLIFNDKIIDEIKNLNQNFKKEDLLKLKRLTENLQSQVNELTLKNQNLNKSQIPELSKIDQINSLYKLVLIKYKNGNNINSELLFLQNLLEPNKNEIFEKLNILQLKKFYGLENLFKEFEISSNNFLKSNFIEKNNNNYMITFLSKFIDIKPSNSNKYHSDELSILIQAKKYMENEDIKESLRKVLLIDENSYFFSKWIGQAKIYLDFTNEIAKVI